MAVAAPSHAALCIACNYPLRDMAAPRCAECGREFNPENPASMNLTGRPVGGLARRLLRPPLWALHLIALVTLSAHLWLARLPWPMKPRQGLALEWSWAAIAVIWGVLLILWLFT